MTDEQPLDMQLKAHTDVRISTEWWLLHIQCHLLKQYRQLLAILTTGAMDGIDLQIIYVYTAKH